MKFKKWYFIVGVVIVLTISVIMFYGIPSYRASQILSKKDAMARIMKKYPGEITHIQLEDHRYFITLEKGSSTYKIKMDAYNGNITSLIQTKQIVKEDDHTPNWTEEQVRKKISSISKGDIESLTHSMINHQLIYTAIVMEEDQRRTIQIDSKTGEILINKLDKETIPNKRLSEQEAIKIALKQVQGEVDDVDFDTIDSMPYYFVQIETADNYEAEIQIHAITGEVKSVTWDD
ncbi:PepSY domain-containing protein [Heyndrickxia sp. FSL K6-6286]|uniref:PepSY domain-containing protein n=1 Tax=Heyndrickxia sp. FSL K6-6286 TaxID=2921510 RepID=UPI000903E017|nr:hypothetical protein BLX88_06805 [Bacillus obstructivus]